VGLVRERDDPAGGRVPAAPVAPAVVVSDPARVGPAGATAAGRVEDREEAQGAVPVEARVVQVDEEVPVSGAGAPTSAGRVADAATSKSSSRPN
jgi:hypothetical protein